MIDRNSGYLKTDLETMPEGLRRTAMLQRVREGAVAACRTSAGVRRQFEAGGLDPASISDLDDLRRLPLIRKRDHAQLQNSDPPFGGFLSVPPAELGHVFVSPGPIYDPETRVDDFWRLATPFHAVGFRPGDLVQNTFSYHLTPAGLMVDATLRALGCTVVPAGVGNTEIQVTTMRDLGVTAYVGTPSFLMTILGKAAEMGLDPKGDFRLVLGCVAGEMLAPSLRRTLQEQYGLTVRQCYITADLGAVAYECPEESGLHIHDEVHVEILDPLTGETKAPGEVGEVTVTTLRPGYPLFRFATGDLSRLLPGACPCGRTAERLAGVLGRADEVTKVRGMFIHPGMISEILERSGACQAGQAVVTRSGHQDDLLLRVVPTGEGDRKNLTARLQELSREILKLRAEVAFVTREELGAYPKRIDDRRTWD